MSDVLQRVAAALSLAAVLGAASGCERRAEVAWSALGPPVSLRSSGSRGARELPLPPFELVGAVRRGVSLVEGEKPTGAEAAPGASGTSAPGEGAALTLIAGGDVSFGRKAGQILLREPGHDFFSSLAPLLDSADERFCNLEGPLSDQGGETVSPSNNLVFTGPPSGADALARAGFTFVSTANNHIWDYGKDALFETMDNLRRVGVRHVGTGRNWKQAYRPLIIDRNGFRLAVIAVTHIWNQGSLWQHPASFYVAGADPEGLPVAVRNLRKDPSIDAIAISYHGLAEYIDAPMSVTRDLLQAVIDAGADIVIGHHPHVVQGVEWRGGRPILYSLGNLLMRMNSEHPWTEMGYLARIRLARGELPQVEACPFRMQDVTPLRFVGDPARDAYESKFFGHLASISRPAGGTAVGAPGEDGCAPLSPPEGKVSASLERSTARSRAHRRRD